MANTVYLAGPMAGIERWNFPAFDAAAERVREAGHVVVSPAEICRGEGFDESKDHTVSLQQYREFLKADFRWLLACDTVMLLNGWQQSGGARKEALLAIWIGTPVVDEDWRPVDVEMELRSELDDGTVPC